MVQRPRGGLDDVYKAGKVDREEGKGDRRQDCFSFGSFRVHGVQAPSG